MKPAHTLTLAFLVVVTLAHILRLLLQWELVINHVTIPMWPSVVAIIVLAGLAVALWRESNPMSP